MDALKKDPKYIESMVMTASPEELVVITYKTLLDALNSAIIALNNNEIQKFEDEINFSRRAVRELTVSLDMSQEISESLISVYFYVQKLLAKAHLKKDAEKVRESINILTPLYEGWKEVSLTAEPKQTNVVAGITYGKDDIDVVANISNGYKA